MSTNTATTFEGVGASALVRTLDEGYGPGAWHGPDLRAALSDVDDGLSRWKPSPARHSIAEIALHHAYHLGNVHSKLTGEPRAPFVLTGDDWFELPPAADLSWPQIQSLVESNQQRLREAAQAIAEGRIVSPLSPAEQFELVLGIASHAIYHAGQIQLLKRLAEEA
jgi:hypothetical protein